MEGMDDNMNMMTDIMRKRTIESRRGGGDR